MCGRAGLRGTWRVLDKAKVSEGVARNLGRRSNREARIALLPGIPQSYGGVHHRLTPAVNIAAESGSLAERVCVWGRGRHIRAAGREYSARCQKREQVS